MAMPAAPPAKRDASKVSEQQDEDEEMIRTRGDNMWLIPRRSHHGSQQSTADNTLQAISLLSTKILYRWWFKHQHSCMNQGRVLKYNMLTLYRHWLNTRALEGFVQQTENSACTTQLIQQAGSTSSGNSFWKKDCNLNLHKGNFQNEILKKQMRLA